MASGSAEGGAGRGAVCATSQACAVSARVRGRELVGRREAVPRDVAEVEAARDAAEQRREEGAVGAERVPHGRGREEVAQQRRGRRRVRSCGRRVHAPQEPLELDAVAEHVCNKLGGRFLLLLLLLVHGRKEGGVETERAEAGGRVRTDALQGSRVGVVSAVCTASGEGRAGEGREERHEGAVFRDGKDARRREAHHHPRRR